MPCTYRIDRQLRVVFTTLVGIATDEDIAGHQLRLRNDADYEAGFHQLIDRIPVTEVRVTSQGISAIATANIFPGDARRALVVDREVIYGMARMFQIMRNGAEQMEMFRDIDGAKAWLGIKKEQIE